MPHPFRLTRLASMLLAGLCLVSGTPLLAAAPIYQWRDAGGITHYGDNPPAASRPVRLRQGPAAPAADAEVAAIDAAACERKREQLKGYRLADKVTETNALGDVREYSDAERQALIAGTEAQVRAACGEEPAAP